MSVQAPQAQQSAGGTAPPRAESIFDLARGLLRELPGLVGDRVELFALEMRRAGAALAQMLALTIVAAILGVTAWLALWGIVVAALVEAGWHGVAAYGLVVVVNVAAALWALWRARGLLALLSLPATRHHLSLGSGAGHPAIRVSVDEHRAVESGHAAAAR